jgi:hypothetical protein
MTCDNCKETAKYELKDKARSQLYCAAHLPWFIKLSKDLGTKVFEVEVFQPRIPEPTPEPEVKSAAKKKPVVAEVVVEEVVEEVKEETVVDEEK